MTMEAELTIAIRAYAALFLLYALEWQYRRWSQNLSRAFKFTDDMKSKDPALYALVKDMTVVDAVDIWVQTYPEDFPNRELKVIR